MPLLTQRPVPSSLSARAFLLTFLSLAAAIPASPQFPDATGQSFYVNAHPYLEDPLDQLLAQIPELQGLHPATDQQTLPMTLSRTGHSVEAFFQDIVDLLAHEEISQEKLNAKGAVKGHQHRHYNYLIIRNNGGFLPSLEEYRTDSHGSRIEQSGLSSGFTVTSGFTLTCIHFLPELRSESTFRYLGDQMLESRHTFVVAFAQRPAHATATELVSGYWGTVVILVQGIAWIDQDTYQILRLRTDLLAPRTDIGLTRQTTEVTFGEVQLPDITAALWLPSKVSVYAQCMGNSFRNEHLYTDYQRFRVSVRMLPQ